MSDFFRHLCPIAKISLPFLFHSQTRSKKKSLQIKGIPWGPLRSPELVSPLEDSPSITSLGTTQHLGFAFILGNNGKQDK